MCVIFIVCFLIVSINANFNVTNIIPSSNTSTITNRFTIEISQAVNRPTFSAFIHIYNATNNKIDQFNVQTYPNLTYGNNSIVFYVNDTIKFNVNDEYFITLDVGVLFSNGSLNSTARTDINFWRFRFIDLLQTSTSVQTAAYTSMQTTYSSMTDSSMKYSDTSASSMTTMISTSNSSNKTTATMNTTTSTIRDQRVKGEPSATRSAQLGMGFGITFIAVIIILEVAYFKYCYDGSGRSNSYFT